jgi:hypothetical protein
MIERVTADFGRLVFDRDAIVRAALRAYVETSLHGIARFWDPAFDWVDWEGNLERGALLHIQDCNHVVVAWTEAGIVGLAYELGCGPVEQLDLSPDAVTGGPDDVRGAVTGLPDELEPALVLATSMLPFSGPHGERTAGAGFWLYGDRGGGTLFVLHLLLNVYHASGVERLAPWGLLHNGRLLPRTCEGIGYVRPGKVVINHVRPQDAPAHAIMDAVVDRRLKGPTEFTPAELETLLHPGLGPEQLLGAQRSLQVVGITWPGSPDVPPATPQPRLNPFTDKPFLRPDHGYLIRCFGPIAFNRDAIVRAALRAYVETILAPLDPLARHVLTACVLPKWTGDVQQGAFFNGDGCGNYDVVAWTEAGVVGLAYKRGHAAIEQLGAALPGLPDELLPALEMAAGLLEVGANGEKLVCIGFWLLGDRTGGTLFDDPTLPAARRLAAWGALDRIVPWNTLDETGKGRLPLLGDRDRAALAVLLARTTALPIHALLDAVVDRRLRGPTELLPDELATLFPVPIDMDVLVIGQRELRKVGITWPGSSEMT